MAGLRMNILVDQTMPRILVVCTDHRAVEFKLSMSLQDRQIVQHFLAFDFELRGKGFRRITASNAAGDSIFNLPHAAQSGC
jgi:hypothetical protein